MKAFLVFVFTSLALSATGLPVDGNATRQCPSVYFSLAPGFGSNFAPEFNLCPGAGPQGNLLVGYTQPFAPQKDIFFAPYSANLPVVPQDVPQHSFLPAIDPGASVPLLGIYPKAPVITDVPPNKGPVSFDPGTQTGVPEPASMGLMALGLLGLVIGRKKYFVN